MSTITLFDQMVKFLTIQLLDTKGINFSKVMTTTDGTHFEIEDLQGNNFGLPEDVGIRVKVKMNQSGLNQNLKFPQERLFAHATYYKYQKGYDNLLFGEKNLGIIHTAKPIDFLSEKVEDVNIRELNLDATNNYSDKDIIKGADQLSRLFIGNPYLASNGLGKNHVKFLLLGYNGSTHIQKAGLEIRIKYYNDEIYMLSKSPNYAGTLVVSCENVRKREIVGTYSYATTIEEHKQGAIFNLKEIVRAITSGQHINHDFR